MKNLLLFKQYPLQGLSGGEFNLDNRDWHKLDGRIEIEHDGLSKSSINILYPKHYDRDVEMLYAVNCKSNIPGVPVAMVENYFDTSNPITKRISTSSDSWQNFPLNTYRMSNLSYSPSNIYGRFTDWKGQKPYILLGSQYNNENYATYRISPDWKTPTINEPKAFQNGVQTTNIDPRLQTDITWEAQIQDYGEATIAQNGIPITVIAFGEQRKITIPARTIKDVGAFAVTLVIANNPIDDIGVYGGSTINFNISVPSVSANNFVINQLERRSPIIGTWDSTNQSDFRLEVVRSGLVEYVKAGGAEKSFTIPPGTLLEGEVEFRLSVNSTFGSATTTVVLPLTKTITFSKPLITSLEPAGLNQNLDLALPITWVCANQETYNLKVYSNNQLAKEYSGTSDKGVTLPPKTLRSSTVKLVLTATNTINGIIGVSTRESTFLGYGTPSNPVFEDVELYNKALPIIRWNSLEQIQYEFKITTLAGVVQEQSPQLTSQNRFYQVTKNLNNNTKYKISVRIKSAQGLWSEWAEKIINVSYTIQASPTIKLIADTKGNIIVSIDLVDSPVFSTCEIWRREDLTDWVRLVKDLPRKHTWSDPTARIGVTQYYKCAANFSDGSRSQSATVSIVAQMEGYFITDVENPERQIELLSEDSQSESPVSLTQIGDEVFSLFLGASKPVMEKGLVNYNTATMSFLVPASDLNLLSDMKKNSKLLLYKDERGNKLYGNIQGDLSKKPKKWFKDYADVSFDFVENNFLEEDIASNIRMYLRCFDGTWKFDGSVDFNPRYWGVIN